MSRTDRVRLSLSDWHFWVGVAYFGLVVVVVGLYFVNNRTSRANAQVAKEAAVHQAELTAAAKTARLERGQKVARCLASRPELGRINRFVKAVQDTHEVLTQNSKAIVEATSPSDPTYQTRLSNYLRIKATVPEIAVVRFHVPTRSECLKLGHPATK